MTYTVGINVRETHLFQTLDATTTSFTGTVGSDGNLWGKFTAPDDGFISVEETKMCSSDGYIAIYESNASAFTSGNALQKNDDDGTLYRAGKLTNVPVQAGHTYIIKGGSYYDKDKVPGQTGSSYAGGTETISFSYTSYSYQTFTGDEGDLIKKSMGNTYISATLDGNPFNATPNGDQSVYTSKTSVFDSGAMNVTTTTKTYTLGDGILS